MTEPAPYRFTWTMARRFVVFALIAWISGSIASEGWALADEAAFHEEVEAQAAQGQRSFRRDRRWPGNGSLLWDVEQGYSAVQGGTISLQYASPVAPTDADTE